MSTTQTKKLESLEMGLSADSRGVVVDALNGLLADLFVLYTKARSYHWNVVGEHFFTLHPEFEKLYDGLAEDIDEVAERTRSLGGVAIGSLAQFLERSNLKEANGVPEARQMVSDLASDFESVIRSLRDMIAVAEGAKDAGTADFFTGLVEEYEKTAWMLRAYLR